MKKKPVNIVNEIYREQLGYACIGVKIKPVHIANGLFRAVCGGHAQTRLLNHTVVRYTKGEEIHATEALIRDWPHAWGDLGRQQYRQELNSLRRLLRGLVRADGAVFPTENMTSYTLTHRFQITSDPSDGGIGTFLYNLASTAEEGKVVALLMRLIEETHDEVTTALVPLTQQGEPKVPHGRESVVPVPDGAPERLTMTSPFLQWARQGFERVASWEETHGAKATTLQRIVTFGCLVVLFHMAHRESELDGKERVPLLLCYLRGDPTVEAASHQTFRLVQRELDKLAQRGVRESLRTQFDLMDPQDRNRVLAERIQFRGQRGRISMEEEVIATTVENEQQGMPGDLAFARALAEALLEDAEGQTAADFWRSLGVRTGLLVPRGTGAVRKRFEPAPRVLSVLMASLLGAGERIPFTDLLKRMHQDTGCIVGGLPKDVQLLRDLSIFEATEQDLAWNAEAFRRHLIDAGFAREFADGVTIVSLESVR